MFGALHCVIFVASLFSTSLLRSLYGNDIRTIGSGALDDNTALKTLYLQNNKLMTLDQRLFDTTISLQTL